MQPGLRAGFICAEKRIKAAAGAAQDARSVPGVLPNRTEIWKISFIRRRRRSVL